MKPNDLDELLVRADMLEEKGDAEGSRLLRQLVGEARLPSLTLGSRVELDVHGTRVPAVLNMWKEASLDGGPFLYDVAITAEFTG